VPCRLGYKVALIDADVGLRNLDLLLGLENRVLYTAIDILEGDCRCVNPISDWMLHRKPTPSVL
jgi:septum formation inhibitor-activating ATPase MinD